MRSIPDAALPASVVSFERSRNGWYRSLRKIRNKTSVPISTLNAGIVMNPIRNSFPAATYPPTPITVAVPSMTRKLTIGVNCACRPPARSPALRFLSTNPPKRIASFSSRVNTLITVSALISSVATSETCPVAFAACLAAALMFLV